MIRWRSLILTGIFLVPVFALGIGNLSQPILENYVGRQIPTAMVARNLERGSGFLHPQLDTGPFPNLFLVEPPIYAQLVSWFDRLTGLGLDPSGRFVSVIGMALAVWGLIGLERSRCRVPLLPLWSICAFLMLPVCVRFMRSFQPDMLALGLVLAGLRVWDEHEDRGGWSRLATAWILVAVGLAVKVLTAYALVPLILVILRPGRRPKPPTSSDPETWASGVGEPGQGLIKWSWNWGPDPVAPSPIGSIPDLAPKPVRLRRPVKLALAFGTLLPALAWYVYAVATLRAGGGSRASSDNAGYWMKAMSLAPLFHLETYRIAARMLFWRAFGPVAIVMASVALFGTRRSDRLWLAWGISASAMLVLLAGKTHHEYYWLALAPVVAVETGRALPVLMGSVVSIGIGGRSAGEVGAAFLNSRDRRGFGRAVLERSCMALIAIVAIPILTAIAIGYRGIVTRNQTDNTPREWAAWPVAVKSIREHAPAGDWIVATEAILYLADRKGCRLEYEPKGRVRAAGEWGATIDASDPLALVEFYRSKGATIVCDLWPLADEPERRALHDAIRRRYNVIVDRDGVILAALVDRK